MSQTAKMTFKVTEGHWQTISIIIIIFLFFKNYYYYIFYTFLLFIIIIFLLLLLKIYLFKWHCHA